MKVKLTCSKNKIAIDVNNVEAFQFVGASVLKCERSLNAEIIEFQSYRNQFYGYLISVESESGLITAV